MQNLSLKIPIFDKFESKIKMWAPTIFSVGNLQLSVPPTFYARQKEGTKEGNPS